ncbi:MAG: hydrolase TatD, partial [Planctomycetota bacterium]
YNVWANHSLYPITKLTPERMVEIVKQYGLNRMLVSSAADWGVSDPLAIPKTIQLMKKHGFSSEEIEQFVFKNPCNFFSRSDRFSIEL